MGRERTKEQVGGRRREGWERRKKTGGGRWRSEEEEEALTYREKVCTDIVSSEDGEGGRRKKQVGGRWMRKHTRIENRTDTDIVSSYFS